MFFRLKPTLNTPTGIGSAVLLGALALRCVSNDRTGAGTQGDGGCLMGCASGTTGASGAIGGSAGARGDGGSPTTGTGGAGSGGTSSAGSDAATEGGGSSGFVFPLKASANGRYLVDQKGTPFRIHADSAWSLIANLTPAEVDTYLADRKSRGFNTLLVSLIERKFAVQAPRNRAGDYPFVAHNFGSYDFTTPYEPYFTHADSVIDKIAASGMVVMLDVMYTAKDDDGNEGWWKELTNATNTPAKCYAYGQILGKRWKNRANLVWIFGGDYTPPAGLRRGDPVAPNPQGTS